VTLDDLKPGLRHSATIRVSGELAVPAGARVFGSAIEMPPVFATAQMIAFVEWTCVAALDARGRRFHRTRQYQDDHLRRACNA
jgi:fluoroacetyl-CoA thioesterase